MTMPMNYVPIEKRVSVEPLLTVSDAMLKVYTGNMGAGDGWALLCTPNCVGHAENMAQPIRATIRFACEAVRERCAVEAITLEPRGTAENRSVKWAHAECIAAAIRGLEL